jgi:hypothetical protein
MEAQARDRHRAHLPRAKRRGRVAAMSDIADLVAGGDIVITMRAHRKNKATGTHECCEGYVLIKRFITDREAVDQLDRIAHALLVQVRDDG